MPEPKRLRARVVVGPRAGQSHSVKPNVQPGDLDSANFPSLDSVEHLSLRWLRRTDAVALKKKLRGVRHHVILGTRTDEWITENLDNPFRDWGDDNNALGRGAVKAWKTANVSKRGKPEQVLQTFIDDLNRLDARHDLETQHLEQAADAFLDLATRLGVQKRWESRAAVRA